MGKGSSNISLNEWINESKKKKPKYTKHTNLNPKNKTFFS